jgi:uncharacterized protein (TIGR00369 family)
VEFPTPIPFVETLGLELVAMESGHAKIRLALQAGHHNSFDVAHGGVIMSLLDATMAHAARSMNPVSSSGVLPGVVTVEMKTSFMQAATGVLQAEARVLHRTATLAFCEGSVFSERDEICAHGTGTFMYMRALPTAHGEIKSLRGIDPSEPA